MSIRESTFGSTPDGRQARLFTLENSSGMSAQISDYGGVVVSLFASDRDGQLADVVLGFDGIEGYWQNQPYFGAIIGRCANRIAGARFKLGDTEHVLGSNHGRHHLHGGFKGFDKVLWNAEASSGADASKLSLAYFSEDGEEGYPGGLDVNVTYTLTDGNELRVDYSAYAHEDTIVNLTNHSYFNLAGCDVPGIEHHRLSVMSGGFIAIDGGLIPTGEIISVLGTPMDLRDPVEIGTRLSSDYEQVAYGNGFDHCWVLETKPGCLSPAVMLHDPSSGRILNIKTTKPGVQIFTPDFSIKPTAGKNKVLYNGRNAICFETQHYPNAVWNPHFPSPLLPAGQTCALAAMQRQSKIE
jgi:aldose 1-epimerase